MDTLLAPVPVELRGMARPDDLPLTCTDEELVEAVKVWMVGGAPEALAVLLHVPASAVAQWTKSRGWGQIVEFYKPEVSGVLAGQLGRIGSMCLDQIEERVRVGDPLIGADGRQLQDEEGKPLWRPIRAKDLAHISAQMLETKAKLEGRLASGGGDEKPLGLRDLMHALRASASKDISGESERI